MLERAREMTRQGLEREAEKLLPLEKMRKAISEAAMDGFYRVAVAPEKPLDLTRTETAKATIAALQKEGFNVSWEAKVSLDDRSWFALVISWQTS